MRKQIPTTNTNPDLANIDHVPSSGTHSGSNAMLYIFEDNETVIKMIMKGRSPTIRHVSRPHRVALDWLSDRINLDSKIQIRYIDTKHQLADILTKGNFTRDEWNNLLHLFSISHFSSTCCAENSSLISCPKTMAKRMQEQKEEERTVAKSTLMAMNLSSTVPASSSSAKNLITSSDLRKLIAAGKPASRTRRNSRPDAASSSQVRLQDAHFGGLMETATGKPVATQGESGDVDISESETGSEEDVTRNPVASKTATEKPHASSKSHCQGGPQAEKIEWSHNLRVSPATIHHTESSILDRQGDLRTRTRWPCECFGREHGYLGYISECHSSSFRHKIPSDDILESLYTLKIRESD